MGGGSLYGLTGSFHKKYVNNNVVVDVKCDGTRCTLCLDENGVLWSFGVNLFGKLGLKRNDKKQIYTNPRQISIFKAYKVADFGLTNKCCIAVCANGTVYGWGCYSRSSLGKNSDIWYTPQVISADNSENDVDVEKEKEKDKKRAKYRVFAGFRFIILLNEVNNRLFVINTEFGYTVLKKEKHGFMVKMDEIKLPSKGMKVKDVVPSNESAIIICEEEESSK